MRYVICMNYYYGKTILVIGAAGLIGSHLVEKLMNTRITGLQSKEIRNSTR